MYSTKGNKDYNKGNNVFNNNVAESNAVTMVAMYVYTMQVLEACQTSLHAACEGLVLIPRDDADIWQECNVCYHCTVCLSDQHAELLPRKMPSADLPT